MLYYTIWIRGVKHFFTWSSRDEISIGARVIVPFRNRLRIGIIIEQVEKPTEYDVLPIKEVLDAFFVTPQTIAVSKRIAFENASTLQKILGLCVSEVFMTKKDPAQYDMVYTYIPECDESCIIGKKQKEVLQFFRDKQIQTVSQSILSNIASPQTLKTLEQKGILKKEKKGITRTHAVGHMPIRKTFPLTKEQNQAYESIMQSQKPVLLFGVTGSGKTEIYKHIAKDILQKDSSAQVLFLLPEIALTAQLIADFESLFPHVLSVWHSQMSQREKTQEYERIRYGHSRILIGTRSALWAPFQNLKVLLIDEEHEWTFKNESSPRYWAHDVAHQLSQEWQAKLVLGSATPRIESLKLCDEGVWNMVSLDHRVHKTKMPHVHIVDLKNEAKKGNYSPFSEDLIEALKQTLRNDKQAVLFLNKRGYSGSTQCKHCGHCFECPNCSHNMKMHEQGNNRKFICHICGHLEPFRDICPECKTKDFQLKGWGTQMVEKKLKELFPEETILRADADSIKKREDFHTLLNDFHGKKGRILLGTQMIAKGLDFDDVHLVGVLLADVGLNLPDFRSEERVFQLLMQVSGRAGRREAQGEIYVQTFQSQDPLFSFLKKYDTKGFLQIQKEKRKTVFMPPYIDLLKITYSHEKKNTAYNQSRHLLESVQQYAQKKSHDWHIDYAPAFFPRTHNKYHFHVYIRGQKQDLLQCIYDLRLLEETTIKIDMNPSSIL